MSLPTRKQSQFDGARRPWNVAGDQSKGPAVKYKQPQEVIDHCLMCTLPESLCKGDCRIQRSDTPPRKSPVPDGFDKHYLSGARIGDNYQMGEAVLSLPEERRMEK